jgi:hypothetical protein
MFVLQIHFKTSNWILFGGDYVKMVGGFEILTFTTK